MMRVVFLHCFYRYITERSIINVKVHFDCIMRVLCISLFTFWVQSFNRLKDIIRFLMINRLIDC